MPSALPARRNNKNPPVCWLAPEIRPQPCHGTHGKTPILCRQQLSSTGLAEYGTSRVICLCTAHLRKAWRSKASALPETTGTVTELNEGLPSTCTAGRRTLCCTHFVLLVGGRQTSLALRAHLSDSPLQKGPACNAERSQPAVGVTSMRLESGLEGTVASLKGQTVHKLLFSASLCLSCSTRAPQSKPRSTQL